MAGSFNFDLILAAAGRDLAEIGGRPTDADLLYASEVLGPWLTQVDGSNRELTDDATGIYVAVAGKGPDHIRIHAGVNGPLVQKFSAGTCYGSEGQAAILSLRGWADTVARESTLAVERIKALVVDFESTCIELGLPVDHCQHNYGGGWAVEYNAIGARSKSPQAPRLPDGYEPSVNLSLFNSPTVSVRSSYSIGEAANLRLAILATSDAGTTVAKVSGWLRDELVRIAASLGKEA